MKEAQLKRFGKVINFFAVIFPRLTARLVLYKFTRPIAKRGFDASSKAYLNSKSDLKYVQIDGTKIASYHWKGDGPKVLLCHGWESNSSRWKSLVNLLVQNNYDVYAFDAPAHGFSEGSKISPEEFVKVVRHFDQQEKFYALVGHSFGGFNVIFYASEFAKNMNKIVAIAATNSIEDVVLGMQQKMGFSDRVINYFNQAFIKTYGSPPKSFSAEKFVTQIKSKGLIIHDLEDPILPYAGSQAIHKSWKNSELLSTSGKGHRVRSKSVNEAILKFLSTE